MRFFPHFFYILFLISALYFKGFSQSYIIPNSNQEINIDSNSLTIYWKTFFPMDTKIEYGLTNTFESGTVYDPAPVIEHTITLKNLKSGSIYHLRCSSKSATAEAVIPDWIMSTASGGSGGRINVYFNKSVYTGIALGETVNYNADFPNILVNRIDSAAYSIDFCVYSFSGTPGAGDNLANALINAKNRGVKVRFIMEDDNQNTAPVRKLRSAGIEVVTDKYGNNDGGGLHHNKFFIFDARDTVSDRDDYVITGSWNATDPGSYSDFQNIIEIQDKALSLAFTEEFNEMWGSNTDTPNTAKSRFGKNKRDNTPHRFNIKGTRVELYFTPSDGVSSKVQSKITNATSSICFSEMTFTSGDIANAMYSAYKSKNIKIRGLINWGNRNDQGLQYEFLTQKPAWADVLYYQAAGIFHHKYILIDAERPQSDSWALTGSYNLSKSAESENDENLLFVRNSRIANLYLQEFTKRYYEAGGKDTLSIVNINGLEKDPQNFILYNNYPNPFNGGTIISYSLPKSTNIKFKVYNVLGKEINTFDAGYQEKGIHSISWTPENVSAGVYYYFLITDYSILKNKLIYLK